MLPAMTAHIETRDTLWFQVQETVFIERLRLAEIDAEIDAYEPLVSHVGELTVRLELDRSWARLRGPTAAEAALESLYLKVGAKHAIVGDLLPQVPMTHASPLVYYARFRLQPDIRMRFLSCHSHLAVGFTGPTDASEGRLSEHARTLVALDWQRQP